MAAGRDIFGFKSKSNRDYDIFGAGTHGKYKEESDKWVTPAAALAAGLLIPGVGSAIGQGLGAAGSAIGSTIGAAPGVIGQAASNIPGIIGEAGKFIGSDAGKAVTGIIQQLRAEGRADEAAKLERESAQQAATQNQQAYQDYLKRSSEMGAEGEKQFMAEIGTTNPMQTQVMKDLQAQAEQQQGIEANRIKSQLAQMGVRGGQAAALLGRGTSEIAKSSLADRNRLAYEDYATRQKQRAEAAAGKAARGQAGTVNIQPRYI